MSEAWRGANGRVLVTGGTGSFGRAFVRRMLSEDVPRVVVFSRSEALQAAMAADLHQYAERLRFMLGDVRDPLRLMDACRGVDVVVHAAAMKRVESCEADPSEALSINAYGTQHLARACIERGVRHCVLLSTDKAAAPNTLYGATKQTAERLWLGANVYAAGGFTRFSATRYGNVLGSTGSVVPLWRAQAARGEPLGITDLDCTRFWMTMEQAVDLVMLALTEMRGGEVFVPKAGRSGLGAIASAAVRPPWWFAPPAGLRPGEKLHETLITEDEARTTWDCGTHYVIEPPVRLWGVVPDPRGQRVPPGFVLRSDIGPTLDMVALQEMMR